MKYLPMQQYLHITSNNTIYGTQLQQFPKSPIPVVCDMSSDIFSRKINVADFGLIYAGAQKNMGPAGVTLVIVKDEILGKIGRKIPAMLNYQVQIEGGSMYNTPPCICYLRIHAYP
jgi:phosphoserine aminotransferase